MTKSTKQLLKIGFVLDGGLEEPDGVQQYILCLGEYYKSLGHKIRYVVAGKVVYGKEDAISLNPGLPVRSNGNKLMIPLLPPRRSKLRKFMKSEKFDVLHVQAPYHPALGEQLIFLADKNTAIIGTFHIVPHYRILDVGNYILGLWSRRSIKRFDKLLSVSSAAARVAKRDFGVDTEILPNVIDYDRFNKALPLPGDRVFTILFLGRLVERKGCLELLKAVYALSQMPGLPKFRVVVYGKGPLLAVLEDYVKNHNLGQIVEFRGFISEVLKPRAYASADISVFPALGGESFGIVLLEAMASGRSAVIAGDNEGYKSVLEGAPELLFSRHDEVALAHKMAKFMTDDALRHKYAKWGSTYSKDFDVKVVGNKLLDIYAGALLKKRLS